MSRVPLFNIERFEVEIVMSSKLEMLRKDGVETSNKYLFCF